MRDSDTNGYWCRNPAMFPWSLSSLYARMRGKKTPVCPQSCCCRRCWERTCAQRTLFPNSRVRIPSHKQPGSGNYLVPSEVAVRTQESATRYTLTDFLGTQGKYSLVGPMGTLYIIDRSLSASTSDAGDHDRHPSLK